MFRFLCVARVKGHEWEIVFKRSVICMLFVPFDFQSVAPSLKIKMLFGFWIWTFSPKCGCYSGPLAFCFRPSGTLAIGRMLFVNWIRQAPETISHLCYSKKTAQKITEKQPVRCICGTHKSREIRGMAEDARSKFRAHLNIEESAHPGKYAPRGTGKTIKNIPLDISTKNH